jgi:hypothetical protein
MAYTTLLDKLKSENIDPVSIDLSTVTKAMHNQGIKSVGYTNVDNRYLDLFYDSEELTTALRDLFVIKEAQLEPISEVVEEPIQKIEQKNTKRK